MLIIAGSDFDAAVMGTTVSRDLLARIEFVHGGF